jgi:acetolactate synthase small subunit
MSSSHTVAVLLDEDLLTFNRVIGVVRRRNLPVAGITVGPSGRPGQLRLTFLVTTDDANAERLLRQLEKAHGVREAQVRATTSPAVPQPSESLP